MTYYWMNWKWRININLSQNLEHTNTFFFLANLHSSSSRLWLNSIRIFIHIFFSLRFFHCRVSKEISQVFHFSFFSLHCQASFSPFFHIQFFLVYMLYKLFRYIFCTSFRCCIEKVHRLYLQPDTKQNNKKKTLELFPTLVVVVVARSLLKKNSNA